MNNARTIVFLTLPFFFHKPGLSNEKNHEILEVNHNCTELLFCIKLVYSAAEESRILHKTQRGH